MTNSNELISLIKWDSNGLVTCVAQDAEDHSILMVAYMNEVSLKKTLEEGKVCYFSRSRNKLWLKGEESGNFQILKEIAVDCDGDCLLVWVTQVGKAACHTGMRSCFYRKLDSNGKLKVVGEKIFDPEKVYRAKK